MVKTTQQTTKPKGGFTAEERAAMQDRAREMKSANSAADAERDLRDKIGELPEPDRSLAERVHAIITASVPELAPRTYYGMPAYAKDGKVICFLQPASKFKVRYATLGFQPDAKLDDGSMWPIGYALTELTPAIEERIAALVKQAAS
jgi:uncharacterized protein YdhG (YjbR/CyaY superfamily)